MLRRILGLDHFTGRHMAGVMVLFFGTIISVNLTMAFLATKSWTGLVVPNSYVASQHFDGDVALRRAQDDLGWHPRLQYQGDRLEVEIAGPDGAPISDLSVLAGLGRPTHEGEDRSLTLIAGEGEGGYQAAVALKPGFWDATLTISGQDGAEWEGRWRIWVDAGS